MIKTLIIVFSILACLLPNKLAATHLMGGEITWECLGNGLFVFELKLYRDCSGEALDNNYELTVFNHPSLLSIPLEFESSSDITPTCNGISFDCASGSSSATEEYIYRSEQIQITGIPPAEGYVFTFNECCRNTNISNLANLGTIGMTLRAIMYPFNNQSLDVCYDSSPVFNSIPSTVVCSGLETSFNYSADDADLDSLIFSWAYPIDTMGGMPCATFVPEAPCVNELTFNTNYSFDSPLPGISSNSSNVPAVLNTSTGEINYTSYTSGSFLTVVKVKAYRCGVLVAEVFREIQVIIIGCGNPNDMPTVSAPFQDQGGNQVLFTDTVYAGDLVNFDITFYDDDFSNGNPQNLELFAFGNQFGTNFTNPSSGCLNPPCATLNSALPQVSTDSVGVTFNWQTTCDHIALADNCVSASNTYNFVIQATDDFCQAPATKVATVSITVLAQPTVEVPVITCLSVAELPDVDVNVSWVQPTDPFSNFDHYSINYSVDLNSGYQSETISDFNTTSYTHNQILSGASEPYYYYLEAQGGCHSLDESGQSDTLATIFLLLTTINSQVGLLEWNSPLVGSNASASLTYDIYRKNLGSNWELINSIDSLSYLDTNWACGEQVNYRIKTNILSGCEVFSNVETGFFEDDLAPELPFLDSVSVVNGLSVLGWESSISQDAIGYIIYRFDGTVYIPIDTVPGIDSTYFSYSSSLAGFDPEQFVIASYDSCGNTSPWSQEHASLYLEMNTDKCEEKVSFTWTNYLGWNALEYQIFMSESDGPFQMYQTIPNSESSFIIEGLNDTTKYCFYIRSFDNLGRSSSSNVCCDSLIWFKSSRFDYLANVSVSDPNEIELKYYTDSLSDTEQFQILRRRSDKEGYTILDSIDHVGDSLYYYLDDFNLETDKFSYFYYFRSKNPCGLILDSSNVSKSILLYAEPLKNLSNQIDFDHYESWLASVKEYRVWRKVSGVYESVPVFVTTNDSATFVDDVTTALEQDGEFCYKVEAVESDGNSYGFKEFSFSNEFCVLQYPKISLPNAFTPNGDGTNDIFDIHSLYIDPNQFQMMIYTYDRQLIFDTNDIEIGWNGETKSGKPAPIGVYLYDLKFTSIHNIETRIWGTITLIR